MDQTLTFPPKITLKCVMLDVARSLFGWCGRGILTEALVILLMGGST